MGCVVTLKKFCSFFIYLYAMCIWDLQKYIFILIWRQCFKLPHLLITFTQFTCFVYPYGYLSYVLSFPGVLCSFSYSHQFFSSFLKYFLMSACYRILWYYLVYLSFSAHASYIHWVIVSSLILSNYIETSR